MNSTQNAYLYLVSSIGTAIGSLLLIPLLTSNLTPSEYAQANYYVIASAGYGLLVGLNSNTFITRKLVDCDAIQARKLARSIFTIIITSFIPILFISILLNFLFKFYDPLINVLSLITALFMQMTNTFLFFCIGKQKAANYFLMQVLASVFIVLITLFCLKILNLNWQSRVLGQILPYSGLAIFSFWYFLDGKGYRFTLTRLELSEILSYSLPLMIHTLSFFVLSNIDKLIIASYLGDNDAGVFILAAQIAMLVNLLSDAFNKALIPKVFIILKSQDRLRIDRLFLRIKYFSFSILLAAATIALLLHFLSKFLSLGQYDDVTEVLPLLVFGQMLSFIYLMNCWKIHYSMETGYITKATLISGAITMCLMVLVVPEYGIFGAACITVVGLSLRTLITIFYARKVEI